MIPGCEFLGRSRREYKGRDGSAKVAHHLSLILPSGEPGQMFVSETVYDQAAAFDRGDMVDIEVDPSVYRGEVQLRVGSVSAA